MNMISCEFRFERFCPAACAQFCLAQEVQAPCLGVTVLWLHSFYSICIWLYCHHTFHTYSCRAITRQYAPDEDKARIQKKGIWAGKFQKPSDYRKDQKADGATQSTQQRPQQQPRPQQPRPQPAQQLPLGPRPDQPSASSVGAGTGAKPSYAGVLTGKH